jgi:hypothetical protein
MNGLPVPFSKSNATNATKTVNFTLWLFSIRHLRTEAVEPDT